MFCPSDLSISPLLEPTMGGQLERGLVRNVPVTLFVSADGKSTLVGCILLCGPADDVPSNV